MIVQITEEQYRYFVEGIGVLNEGVDWSKNDDGTINFSINHNTDNNILCLVNAYSGSGF